ncbi:hypothetical protein CDD83_8099 [Cordyceps sp. RAO-2017]|nr:hypothetical protein CDD83_8099 [Cordyceps sp. RAO-2017]
MAVGDASLVGAEVLFDQISEAYEDAYGDNEGLKKALEQLREFHDVKASVLDVGCGPGGPASYLAKLGFEMTGFDVSQNMVDTCRKNVPGNFFKEDMAAFSPKKPFDAIVALYSMFQLSHSATYSVLLKIASWLRPGGTFVLGTIPAEDLVEEKSLLRASDYVERYVTIFMGKPIANTLITTKGWLDILQRAGFLIRNVDRYNFNVKGAVPERHMFITCQRSNLDPLLGPFPLPMFRRAPHSLSEDAWKPFAERLTRHEFDAVVKAVESNKDVLDIGSGHGELPIAIAEKFGKAYAIEPNGDRNEVLVKNGKHAPVEIRQGSAESLPYSDKQFDAAVAL